MASASGVADTENESLAAKRVKLDVLLESDGVTSTSASQRMGPVEKLHSCQSVCQMTSARHTLTARETR